MPENVKKERSIQMHQLAAELKQEMLNEQLGKSVDVLWESQKVGSDGLLRYSGYTPNFMRVETISLNNVLLESKITKTILTDISADQQILQGKLL